MFQPEIEENTRFPLKYIFLLKNTTKGFFARFARDFYKKYAEERRHHKGGAKILNMSSVFNVPWSTSQKCRPGKATFLDFRCFLCIYTKRTFVHK